MKRSHTTVYHPQEIAGPERINRTLLHDAGDVENSQKADLKKYMHSLVYAYNCTPHESTGFAPFELIFGRKPKLPIDIMFDRARDGTEASKTIVDYMDDLNQRMKTTRDIAEQHTSKAKDKQKRDYDRKVRDVQFRIGNQVLVKILSFGKANTAYTVIRPEIPVFKVRSNETSVNKTLHRNHPYLLTHLLPVEETNPETTSDKVTK